MKILYYSPLLLGAPRGYVGGEGDDVVLGEVGNDAFHQFIQGAIASANLKPCELPNDVVGRVSCDPGHRSIARERRTVTFDAGCRLSSASGSELLALRDAAGP